MAKVLVALVALACLLVALTHDPASGTANNPQAASDTVGLIVGHHHAKPLPTPPLSPSQLVAPLVAVLALVLVAREVAVVRDAEVARHHVAAALLVRAGTAPRPGPAAA